MVRRDEVMRVALRAVLNWTAVGMEGDSGAASRAELDSCWN
jgi:hypothetical protein